ncbi:MAG TPA: ABC transporter permease [Verrucomicrobiota bacterium]|nr:multidrug ABC transporter substrate-binding protein [Verrucomicrobiales bacterium]HRI11544.1 ABC transporter permease [Verrucomicrobiota bacterium]
MIAVLRIALRALRRNVLRSFLTMLGIIVGIAAVIVGVSMGAGAKAEVDKRIAGMGQNLLTVMSGNMSRGGVRGGFGMAPNLTVADYDAIRREISGISAVSPEARVGGAQVAVGNQNSMVQVSGVSAEYLTARSWALRSGDNFSEQDVRNANKVCLIGATTAKTLFGENVDPVGQIIRIKNAPFTIVGWLEAKGSGSFGQDQDDIVLVPYTSVMKRLSGDTKFRSLFVQADSPAGIADVQEQLTSLLRQRHQIPEGRDDDFMVRTQQETSDFFNANNRIMTILISFFAGISLVVGGIGIMNIMLVSVTERTREIGIRLAVGARGRDVLSQFLTEAVLLSVLGGGLGIATGFWLAPLLTKYFEFPTLISNSSVIMAFSVSAVIGIVFGFFPALKAARLDPIDALRYE